MSNTPKNPTQKKSDKELAAEQEAARASTRAADPLRPAAVVDTAPVSPSVEQFIENETIPDEIVAQRSSPAGGEGGKPADFATREKPETEVERQARQARERKEKRERED